MKRLVTFPHIAVVFHSFDDETRDIERWCDEVMPRRWYPLCGGDHEFQFDDVLDDGSDEGSTCASYFVFKHVSDLALFKLTWGGAQ